MGDYPHLLFLLNKCGYNVTEVTKDDGRYLVYTGALGNEFLLGFSLADDTAVRLGAHAAGYAW